ncbi:MAG: hypothetical protein OEZ59_02995 [Deltaproteobacteria bacterium]|nr:hypothetical protein [Deltaproteobacteria bacterium]
MTGLFAALLMLGMTLLSTSAEAQVTRRTSMPNIKIGMARNMLSGYQYTLDDGTNTYDNADGMQGNEVSFEWIFFDRISIEIDYGLTPLERNYEIIDGAAVTVNVDESARTMLYGTNIYFNGASGSGFKLLMGLRTGTITVTHEYTGTGSTLDTLSSSVKVPVNLVDLGVDWVFDNAGVRLKYSMLNGKTKVQDSPDVGFTETFEFGGGMTTLGIYSFF